MTMSHSHVLDAHFFERSAVVVAPALLGKFLVRRSDGGDEALMIVETEAYEGMDDRASHASRGRTARTSVMFGPAGYWYVYLVYGMHDMLNIVTGRDGHPGAVLIRAVASDTQRIDGPARLTKKLSINRALNTKRAIPENGLWIEDRGIKIPPSRITKTPRIGVAYAGDWAQKPWRFVVNDE